MKDPGNTSQHDLFNNRLEPQVGWRKPTIQERFEQFHSENPRLWEYYVKFALQMKRAGAKKGGIGMITERIRWYVFIETHGEEGFKISNDYRSRYARKLMQDVPELKDFFNVKELRS